MMEPGGRAAVGSIHTHRYQRWTGQLGSGRWTWLAMVVNGVKLLLKKKTNSTLLMLSLGFAISACVTFYILSLLEEMVGTREAAGLYSFVKFFVQVDISSVTKLGEMRALLWQTVYMILIQVQLAYLLVVLAHIGPGLIADDLKANALPIYFARPITPLTYVLGKWAIIALFLGAGMLAPNLLALLAGVLITGGLQSAAETWRLAGDLAVVGVAVMVVGGMLALAISSLTSDRRYVLVGILAFVLLPLIAQKVINDQMPVSATRGWLGTLSLRADFLSLTDWLFGLRGAWSASGLPQVAYEKALGRPLDPGYALAVLAALTVVSIAVTYWRVLKFSRSTASV